MKTKCILSVLTAAALTVLAGMARADFHVDPVFGNDSNNGFSRDTAFKSGDKAWNAAIAANAAQSPFATASVIHFWPGSASTTNYTSTGTLPTLTNEVVLVGEGADLVPLNANSYLNIGYNTAGPAKMTISNITLAVGTTATRTFKIGYVTSANGAGATGQVAQAGGSLAMNPGSDHLQIGRIEATATAGKAAWGELDLSNVTGPIQFDFAGHVLYIGICSLAPPAFAYGSLNLQNSGGGTLKALSLNVGHTGAFNTKNAEGHINIGSNWTVRIGTSGLRDGLLLLGERAAAATGTVTMAEGGTFEANLNQLYVGKECLVAGEGVLDLSALKGAVEIRTTYTVIASGGSGPAYGVVDAGNSTSVVFSVVNSLDIGYGNGGARTGDAYGKLALGRGTGLAAASVRLGNRNTLTETNLGLLQLNGMELSVSNSIVLSRSGAVRSVVDGKSSGLNLLSNSSSAVSYDGSVVTTVANGGGIGITFVSPPPGKRTAASPAAADSICWGFKWAGNHAADVNTLITAAKLAYETSTLDAVTAAATGVFYDAATDATYIGFYTRDRGPSGTMIRIM